MKTITEDETHVQLTEQKINMGVITLVKQLKLYGGSNGTIQLYNLLKIYLLQPKKRAVINAVIENTHSDSNRLLIKVDAVQHDSKIKYIQFLKPQEIGGLNPILVISFCDKNGMELLKTDDLKVHNMDCKIMRAFLMNQYSE